MGLHRVAVVISYACRETAPLVRPRVMVDQISRLMGPRVEAAKALLPAAVQALSRSVKEEYLAEVARLGLAGSGDPEVAEDYVSAAIERDLVLVLTAYSDWLAGIIWRQSIADGADLPERVDLPKLTDERVEALSALVDAAPDVIAWFGAHLSDAQVVLPGIGRVQRGLLCVDRAAIRAWASCFDWTRDELSARS